MLEVLQHVGAKTFFRGGKLSMGVVKKKGWPSHCLAGGDDGDDDDDDE